VSTDETTSCGTSKNDSLKLLPKSCNLLKNVALN
jgi:hypothetical protein